MSPFRIRLKALHTNNASLPKIQPDPTINPGTVLLFDWGIPYTYSLPAIPTSGTAIVAGTTFVNLVPGGGVATEGYPGGTPNVATQYWGGNGVRLPLTQRNIGLGVQSKTAAASVNEILLIVWMRILSFAASQTEWWGLGDGVLNNSGANNYMQFSYQQPSTQQTPPNNIPLNVAVQFGEHRRWDGTTTGSVVRRWCNQTAAGSPVQSAMEGNLVVMPPGNGCTINATQGNLGHTGNVGTVASDIVYHRVALHNIQAAGGLTADTIVANDFAANYGRFLP